jgi:hypothetical protein
LIWGNLSFVPPRCEGHPILRASLGAAALFVRLLFVYAVGQGALQ